MTPPRLLTHHLSSTLTAGGPGVFWRAMCLIIGLIGLDLRCPQRAGAEPSESTVETIPIASDGDGILLPVFVHGKRHLFLVDTGFGCNAIDTTLAVLRKRIGNDIVIGRTRLPCYSTDDVLVGDSRLPAGAEMGALDLSQFRKVLGREFFGILGMPFLKDYVVRIDFDRGTLTLLKDAPSPEGEQVKLSYDRYGRPRLDGAISGADPTFFMIDTGFIGVGVSLTVEKRMFGRLNDEGRLHIHEIPGRSLRIEGDVSDRVGWLDELPLGRVKHKRLVISEGRDSKIGLSLLSRYVVTFDFPNSRLYLQPGRRVAEADHPDESGLRIWRANGEVEVFEVRAGSPADTAGLKHGYRIQRVNGKPMSAMSLFQLRSLLARPGEETRLSVDRPSGRAEVVIRLSRTGDGE